MKNISKIIFSVYLLCVAAFWTTSVSAQTDKHKQLHAQANLDYLKNISSKPNLAADDMKKVREAMLAIMNEARLNPNYRTQQGSKTALNLPANLKPLILDDRLNKMAQEQANYQASIKNVTHDNANYKDYGARVNSNMKGYSVPEACAGSTNLADYPIGWMKSETHYRPTWNLDNQTVTGVGFGAAKGADGNWYLTAVWADVADPEANKDNLAFGKTATQSSEFSSATGPGNGVDGITKGGMNKMAATNGMQPNWWQVDLGASYDIDRVVVWNRTDCCHEQLQGFALLVSESPITNNEEAPSNGGKFGPFSPWTATSVKSHAVAVNRRGRYVRVAGSKGLALAEVQVFGKAAGQSPVASNATGNPSPKADPFGDGSAATTTVILKYQTAMKPGDKLQEGEKVVSPNGKYQLRGTSNGDFVIEEVQSGRVAYTFPATSPIGNPPSVSFLSYNPDGNLVINNKQSKAYYATTGRDATASVILHKSDHAELTNDGRFVLIDKDGKEIWATSKGQTEAAMDGALTNLALGKSAKQSSDMNVSFAGANKAVDGNTNAAFRMSDVKNSITHTQEERSSWWEVDLGAVYDLDKIVIWNRLDCCWERLQNFIVLTSAQPFVTSENGSVQGDGELFGPLNPWSANMENYTIEAKGKARYVRITLIQGASPRPLSLTEVQVFGK